MVLLLLAGVLAGMITSISPCVLPVLPVILTAGSGGTRRPVRVVAGLATSFAAATLLGSLVLSALGLPQDLLRDIGIAVLLVIGVGLLVPAIGALLERPFARLTSTRVPRGNGFGLGVGLGLLYVPCAGPVLATIAVVGATHHIGWRAVLLTVAFAIGAAVPLLVLALAGDALTRRVSAVRRRAGALRIGSGAVMITIAVLIAFNLTDGLQTHVPGYTTAAQNSIEGGSDVSSELQEVRTGHAATDPLGGSCSEGGSTLENCGTAPAFTGISSWLNTPGDRPLTMTGLRGKVVLIDFWTYSCINCQRALPHFEAWYREYAKDGLVVVGVHTPEFAFEHVRSNVASQASRLGVKYPVAIDNAYGTWNAYKNQYWPAEYLIDAQGHIRHVTFGEGDYGGTETLIRQLLRQAHPGGTLGPTTHGPSAQFNQQQTPETYLGNGYGALHTTSGQTVHGGASTYTLPTTIDTDTFGLGGAWTQSEEYLQAGAGAQLSLRYLAKHVYLVLGGTGTVRVSVDGGAARTVTVSGVPTLYTLASGTTFGAHLLHLSVSPGVQAYDFTFG